MSKYSVGDKVIVRPDLNKSHGHDGTYAVSGMFPLAGKMVTIECVDHGDYRIAEAGYWWTDEMFIQKVEEGERKMIKCDLKVGMLCKLRDYSDLFMVLPTKNTATILVNKTGGYVSLNDYKDDLKSNYGSRTDVMEVYDIAGYASDAVSFNSGDRKLIWQRSEVKELTMDEIAKLAGVPVSQLKIKK